MLRSRISYLKLTPQMPEILMYHNFKKHIVLMFWNYRHNNMIAVIAVSLLIGCSHFIY